MKAVIELHAFALNSIVCAWCLQKYNAEIDYTVHHVYSISVFNFSAIYLHHFIYSDQLCEWSACKIWIIDLTVTESNCCLHIHTPMIIVTDLVFMITCLSDYELKYIITAMRGVFLIVWTCSCSTSHQLIAICTILIKHSKMGKSNS